jgi:signal transduction histidine kinase
MSFSIKKTLKSGVNNIKENFESVKNSIKSVNKTNLSNKSLKNSLERSVKTISSISNKVSNNNNLSYLGIFILIALSIGYYVNKHYNAIIFLYVIGAIIYLLTKNIFYSLLISILVTNFLLSINFFIDNKEGLKSLKSITKTLEKIENTNKNNEKDKKKEKKE